MRSEEIKEVTILLEERKNFPDQSFPPLWMSSALKVFAKWISPDELIEVICQLWLKLFLRLLPFCKHPNNTNDFSDNTVDSEIIDNKYIKEWRNQKERTLPSYAFLSYRVFQHLVNSMKESRFIPEKISIPLAWIISFTFFGHMLTSVGRVAWISVVKRYMKFLAICCGIWTDDLFECYDIHETDVNEKNGEHFLQMSHTLSATISTRAVILQIVPWLTPLATFCHMTASSPIFWMHLKCEKTIPKFAPIWYNYGEARKLAIERELYFSAETDINAIRDRGVLWTMPLKTLSIMMESRGVQMFLNLFLFTFSVAVIYSPDPKPLVLLSLIVLLPYCFIRLLTMLSLIGKTMHITDKDIELWLSDMKSFLFCLQGRFPVEPLPVLNTDSIDHSSTASCIELNPKLSEAFSGPCLFQNCK